MKNFRLVACCRDIKKGTVLRSFSGVQCALRRGDGISFSACIPPYAIKLHELVRSNQWDKATHLCRFVKVLPTLFHSSAILASLCRLLRVLPISPLYATFFGMPDRSWTVLLMKQPYLLLHTIQGE